MAIVPLVQVEEPVRDRLLLYALKLGALTALALDRRMNCTSSLTTDSGVRVVGLRVAPQP